MRMISILLMMLPLVSLADMPGPVRIDDLSVSTLHLIHWLMLAFATGWSLVLWNRRCLFMEKVVNIVLVIGGLCVFAIYFNNSVNLIWQVIIPVVLLTGLLVAVNILVKKFCKVKCKRKLIFLPLVVMTVWWLLGFRMVFVECKTCGSRGVVGWYASGHHRGKCNCCKGKRCHFRLTHMKCKDRKIDFATHAEADWHAMNAVEKGK